jgi:hypothetical protein
VSLALLCWVPKTMTPSPYVGNEKITHKRRKGNSKKKKR